MLIVVELSSMTLERFRLLFADLTSVFLFLPSPTGAVALSAAVFTLPWWSGGVRGDRSDIAVRTIEDGVTEDRISEDGVSEGGVSEGGNTEDGVSEGGNTEDGVIEDGDIGEDRVSEQGITGDGATEEGIADDGVIEDGDIGEDRVSELGITGDGATVEGIADDGATKDGVTEDGIAKDGGKDDRVAEVGIANGGAKLSEDGFWEGVAETTGSNGRDNGKMSNVSSIVCDRLGTQPLDNNDRPAPVEGCWSWWECSDWAIWPLSVNIFTSSPRNLYSPSSCGCKLETLSEGVCWADDSTNGRSGAWDDWVTYGVELGIWAAASCGCCRISGIVESGSGRTSSCERDGSDRDGIGAADAGSELSTSADSKSSILASLSSRFVSLFPFFITRRWHSSGAVYWWVFKSMGSVT
jgi:hypothetical protein